MKRVMSLIAVVALHAMIAGCAISGSYWQQKDGKIVASLMDPGFEDYISIEKSEIVVNPESNLPHATVGIRNVSDNAIHVAYYYTWCDAGGVMTFCSPVYDEGFVGKGEAKELKLVTVSSKSERFTIIFIVDPQ